jgi:hypothetical protein
MKAALLFLCSLFLTGCAFSGLHDPFGAYAARVAVEDRRAAAQETIARYDHDARIAEAENDAWARVGSARAWANTLPLLVLLGGATVVVVVYIRWNGRITLARMRYGFLPTRRPQGVSATLADLQQLAARRNQHIQVVGGVALLIDNETGTVVKRRQIAQQ